MKPSSGAAVATTVSLPVAATPRQPGVRIAAVGDLACPNGVPTTATQCHHFEVSDRLAGDRTLSALLTLGDLQYDGGEAANFAVSYKQSYGRLQVITHPTPGNHDYGARGAKPYFDFFRTRAGQEGKGWYSTDLAPGWHLVSLNSNCTIVGCQAGSDQEQWLRADLAASSAPCTIAIWHHPRFSSGTVHGSDASTMALWEALEQGGGDLVLTGHEHFYERFAPQRSDGRLGGGPASFVVGTGGRSVYGFGAPLAGSEARISDRFGYLAMTLEQGSYSWAFTAEDGWVGDRGTASCR